ncbi:CPBP family intramembrane metalloprotease [Halobacteriales archaeon SW_7_65_23]|jgi:membrane protease YdiL (CAAX protease family)|nr:MAG: CPBP family intramembrane metalloprotease [Halobacteriales archaeon SW_7_65_23]
MTTDPSSEPAVVDAEPERPLFRFGSHEERTRAIAHSLLLVAGAFLVAMVLGAVALELLRTMGLTEESAPVAYNLVSTAVQFVAFLAVCIGYIAWQDCRSLVPTGRPSLRSIAVIVVGFVILVGSLSALEFLFSQLGLEPADNAAVEAGRDNPELYLFMIPLVILLNAPAEELLFRGLVQGRFRRAYGVVPGVLAASAVFGMVHFVALVGTGSQLVYVAIAASAGLILGAAYELTRNLLVPIVMHALWNVAIYLVLYLEATGGL